MTERTHSRATGAIRLVLALWLMVSAVWSLADPQRAVADQGLPMGVVLPLAGLSFTLGVFLLTGFMSRVCGLALVGLGVWQMANYGAAAVPIVEALVGVYLALRGGGAWAMDIYVQKMQDRARRKAAAEVRSPEWS
jgi:uncharacterized membrane protein YphA (DoxX/SURF4 family)